MIATFSAVLVASLLGSPHCPGMCGPFCAVAVAPGRSVRAELTIDRCRPLQTDVARASPPGASGARNLLHSRLALLTAYNAGRLATYLALGAAAGAIGAAVDLGGSLVGPQRAATIGAGAVILAFGLVSILRHLNVPIARAPLPGALQRLLARAHTLVSRLPAPARALSIGLLTTMLPCGWLWAFVITAAGTASPILGLGVMSAFWLGTVPVMLSLGAGLQALVGRLGARLPVLTSVLLIAVGLCAIAGRLTIAPGSLPSTVQAPADAGEVPDPDEPHCPLCEARSTHGR